MGSALAQDCSRGRSEEDRGNQGKGSDNQVELPLLCLAEMEPEENTQPEPKFLCHSHKA